MKVAFDGQIFSNQKYGGISRYFARLASELDSLDTQTKIYAGYHINSYLDDNDSIVKGKYLERYPKRTIRIFRKLNEWQGNFSSVFFKPDIVHETYFLAKPQLKSKGPVVVTVYDMIQELYPERFSASELHTEDKRAALQRADHIISISHNTKADLCRLFDIAEEKVSVTHLAADRAVSAAMSRQDQTNDKPYFLYVGLRSSYKNFMMFAKAFAASERLMKDFRILTFGGGGYSAEELGELSKMGFREHQLQSMGGSDSELAACYSEAVAFVYPSIYEGFGIPPLEAMSYACPVISSNTSSMPEVLGDAALYFDPFDLGDLTGQLEKMAFDTQMRAGLIEAGSLQVEKFSWTKTAAETKAVYAKVLGI